MIIAFCKKNQLVAIQIKNTNMILFDHHIRVCMYLAKYITLTNKNLLIGFINFTNCCLTQNNTSGYIAFCNETLRMFIETFTVF